MLGERFVDALTFSARLHRDHLRKGAGRIPYIAHLLSVAALVIEDGGGEDEAIAALLHDAVEDRGGAAMARQIADRFGPVVAQVVQECTDTDQEPKPPWLPRKLAFIQRVRTASPAGLRVCMADKLHNVRSTLWDMRSGTADPFASFTAGRDGVVWYYRALSDAFRGATLSSGTRLADEVERCVAELEERTGVDGRRVDLSRLPPRALGPV